MSKKITKTDFANWLRAKSPRTKVNLQKPGLDVLNRYMRDRKIPDNAAIPKWAEELTNNLASRGTYSASANAVLKML